MAVVTTLLGTKGADKVSKLLKGATVVDDVARVGAVADDVARVGSVADDVARVGSVADDAARISSVMDDAGRVAELTGKRADEIPYHVFDNFERLKPQRALDPDPGPKLTQEVEQFVTPNIHGDFTQYEFGIRGDAKTKLLWTIDEHGAHFVPEYGVEWPGTRGFPSHTNISETAYFGGEAWRTGPNEITINAGSGAFGYNRIYAKTLGIEDLTAYVTVMQQRFDQAAEYFKQLGFEVKVIPLTER